MTPLLSRVLCVRVARRRGPGRSSARACTRRGARGNDRVSSILCQLCACLRSESRWRTTTVSSYSSTLFIASRRTRSGLRRRPAKCASAGDRCGAACDSLQQLAADSSQPVWPLPSEDCTQRGASHLATSVSDSGSGHCSSGSQRRRRRESLIRLVRLRQFDRRLAHVPSLSGKSVPARAWRLADRRS